MFDYYGSIADSHRRKAVCADTPDEQAHWGMEAERFEELAKLACTNPQAARAAYRPTRTYDS